MSFRLWSIFYVFALLAAAMATFGAWGIPIAVVVLVCWLVMFRGTASGRRLVVVFVITALAILFLIMVVLHGITSVRPAAGRNACQNNLMQLVSAIVSYHSENGSLPPAASTDANGNQLLSWRAAILTRIEATAVSDSLDPTKPWDAPANRQATGTPISIFLCLNHLGSVSAASYFAIRGPQTAWGNGDSRGIRDIGDGPENTILLVEAHLPIKSWAQPLDLTFDEALDLLTKPPVEGDCHVVLNGPFYKPTVTRAVAFADGRVWLAPVPLDREFARALLTANGGEAIDRATIETWPKPVLDYAMCYSFAAFVVLALLPAAWPCRGGPPAPLDSTASTATRD
jgi:hypothetical protein